MKGRSESALREKLLKALLDQKFVDALCRPEFVSSHDGKSSSERRISPFVHVFLNLNIPLNFYHPRRVNRLLKTKGLFLIKFDVKTSAEVSGVTASDPLASSGFPSSTRSLDVRRILIKSSVCGRLNV